MIQLKGVDVIISCDFYIFYNKLKQKIVKFWNILIFDFIKYFYCEGVKRIEFVILIFFLNKQIDKKLKYCKYYYY